ncbi:tail fiber domain-containing protein [Dyadobacter sp. 676]|uniref:Tail fiber domain-containing protein n=1 Tax=Dyadobacter sp. 676 TaxID=3088362 RepID=A0AAU8FP34_9BACT
MKRIYQFVAVLSLAHTMVLNGYAQTHYGVGAGTQGIGHAFFGTEAGTVNTASGSTFLGHQAGISNTTGFWNTFVGNNAGYGCVNGSKNTYVGLEAGYFGNGTGNTFLGMSAGHGNVGEMNVFIGLETGQNSVQGSKNTFLGAGAGLSSDASFNTFVGYRTGYSTTSGVSNTFIGNEAGYSNATGAANAFLGAKAGLLNTDGRYNAFLGSRAGAENTTGERNTYLGYNSGGEPTLINASAIGADAKVLSSNSLVLGNKANVGIGVSAPSFQLHLSTDAAAKAGSPDWIVASDSRLKKNITDFTDGLDLLKQIKPVWFQYNGQAGIKTGDKKFVGIIAQEMQKIAPYTIGTFMHQDSLGNKTEYLDYDANAVTYILINSVKEQQQIIEQKDAELKEVNTQVAALSKRLEQLERIVASNTAKPLNGSAARMEPNTNGVVFEQNVPNGFSGNSAIKYFIPQSVKEATVEVYSVNGVKVNSYVVKERGEG